MSRSDYSDGLDQWDLIRWRGALKRATRGRRGQTLLRELLAALDAMPQKRLIAHELDAGGEVCALGCLGKARSLDMSKIDPNEPEEVSKAFDVAGALAREIVYENDEGAMYWEQETPEKRWTRMRAWVAEQIGEPK